MPEALAAIPQKSVQTGHSSETDASSTAARSSDDASSSAAPPIAAANMKQQRQANAQNQKSRKSKGRRNSQKKPLKVNLQQKTAAAHNLKSQIPRPFQNTRQLTPSSSTTSLSTLSTTTKSTQSTTPRPPGLLRQHSSIRLNFRLRKSTSQMDFKQSRRSGNIGLPMSGAGRGELRAAQDSLDNHKLLGLKIGNMCDIVTNNITKHDKTLLSKNLATLTNSPSTATTTTPVAKSGMRSGGLVVTQSQSTLVQKMFQQDDYYYVLQERDPKVAGMRIFATIMLNAWRKRRDEVKRLTGEVSDLKRGSIKAKNQLHVFNTLFRVEQKRNDELSCQLKRSLEDINQTKSSCESLTTSLISLKADKALLEQQLQIKEQEFEGINTILTQTKSELFKAMAQQRDLQANLSSEQRKVQTLENQKNELINEICELNNESIQKQETIKSELLEKTHELDKINKTIKEMTDKLAAMQDNEQKIADYANAEVKYKADIELLQIEVDNLKKCLNGTLSYRMKACWNQTIVYHKTTLKVVHWIAYYMLPATPPPKPKLTTLPFGLTLQKALSIVKR